MRSGGNMSDIRTPILRVIERNLGETSVSNNVDFQLVDEYFTKDGFGFSIIEHFKIFTDSKKLNFFSGLLERLPKLMKANKQGLILDHINKLFNDLGIPRKCVGVYFEGDYLNILIKG